MADEPTRPPISEELARIEVLREDLGSLIREVCAGMGARFVLVVMTENQPGFATTVSDLERGPMLDRLREVVMRLERQDQIPEGDPNGAG